MGYVCLGYRTIGCVGGLAYILVQAIVLAASVLFVGVHFPFAHPSAGATRKCSNGESEGGVAIGRENKDEMK